MKIALVVGALGIVCLSAGCSASKDSVVTIKSDTRVVNLLQGTAPQGVNLTTPEELQAERLPPGGATAYKSVPIAAPGAKAALEIVMADSATPTQTFTLRSPEIGGLQKRTLIVYGIKGSVDDARKPDLLIVDDPAPPSGSDTAIRVISVSPDIVAPVDLFIGEDIPAQNGQPAQNNARPVFGATNVTFRNPTSYVSVPSGDTKLSLREKGVVLVLPTLARGTKLLSGEKYLLLLFGNKRRTTDPVDVTDSIDALVIPDR